MTIFPIYYLHNTEDKLFQGLRGGGINYILSPTSEFTTNREKYMGLKWGRSNISLYYWWNWNEGMASFCNLNRLCTNPSPLKFNYPSGIEMSPCRNLKKQKHTHNFCRGAWPERKKQKELTGWTLYPLLCREKWTNGCQALPLPSEGQKWLFSWA